MNLKFHLIKSTALFCIFWIATGWPEIRVRIKKGEKERNGTDNRSQHSNYLFQSQQGQSSQDPIIYLVCSQWGDLQLRGDYNLRNKLAF